MSLHRSPFSVVMPQSIFPVRVHLKRKHKPPIIYETFGCLSLGCCCCCCYNFLKWFWWMILLLFCCQKFGFLFVCWKSSNAIKTLSHKTFMKLRIFFVPFFLLYLYVLVTQVLLRSTFFLLWVVLFSLCRLGKYFWVRAVTTHLFMNKKKYLKEARKKTYYHNILGSLVEPGVFCFCSSH